MEHFIITISRGYGSGGKQIAKRLSKSLNIKYYDRELIRIASEQHGINEALFNLADESHKSNPFKKYSGSEILSPKDSDYLSKDNLFNLQAQVIRDLAESGESCVIVGRCAHYILKDDEDVVKVFIHADMEHCIKNVMELNGVNEQEAMSMIVKTDKERALYHKYFTNMDWHDARNYDLCLNTNILSLDQCVEIIIDYIKIMQGIKQKKMAE